MEENSLQKQEWKKILCKNINPDNNYRVLDWFRECNKNERNSSAKTLAATRITRFLLLHFY
jgi:hypothetical protein